MTSSRKIQRKTKIPDAAFQNAMQTFIDRKNGESVGHVDYTKRGCGATARGKI